MWVHLNSSALLLAMSFTLMVNAEASSQRHRKNEQRSKSYPRENGYVRTDLSRNDYDEEYFISAPKYGIYHHDFLDDFKESSLYPQRSSSAKKRHHRRHSGHKSHRATNRSSRRSLEESYQPEIPWPVKKEAVIDGDLVLGGLMMVHSREDSVTCGAVMPQGGVQALEAMLYTLDRVNSDKTLLPNITLGAHILDDCDKDTYGLEMAVDFIKGA